MHTFNLFGGQTIGSGGICTHLTCFGETDSKFRRNLYTFNLIGGQTIGSGGICTHLTCFGETDSRFRRNLYTFNLFSGDRFRFRRNDVYKINLKLKESEGYIPVQQYCRNRKNCRGLNVVIFVGCRDQQN
jgi:hypothetical protein